MAEVERNEPPSDLRPGPIADKNRPGYCYASVIQPLEGFAIKGAVFHQGFNNCFEGHNAHQYWLPPTIKEVDIDDGTIRLTMSTEIKRRDDSAGKMQGFAIAGEDRRFYPADVQWYSDGSVDNRNRPRYQRNVLILPCNCKFF